MKPFRIASLFVAIAATVPMQAAVHAAAPAHHAAAARDWTKTFAATPSGFRVGNPDAKVRLVEYFSFTCPHCAAFAGEGFAALRQKYISTGQVSLELRSALRDRLDYVTALTARCAGPQGYVATVEDIMAAQKDWEQKAVDWDGAHPADFQGDGAVPAMHALVTNAGLEAIASKHGLTPAAIGTCLGDKTSQALLQQSTNDAWNVRKIPGTPAFLINDVLQAEVFSWETLEPKIQAALKG